MSFTIKVDMPNLSPGTRVQVPGLGMFENGKTVRITDEQAAVFQGMNGRPQNREDGSGAVDFVEGPPLDEAKFPEGITVSRESTDAPATESAAASEEDAS